MEPQPAGGAFALRSGAPLGGGRWHSHGQRCGHGGGAGSQSATMYARHLPCMPFSHT